MQTVRQVYAKHFRAGPDPALTLSSGRFPRHIHFETFPSHILLPLYPAMGGLCSKESNESNFVGPGRVLGSAPPREANPRAPLPSGTAQTGVRGGAAQGPGRTLGSATESRSPGAAAAQAADVR
jgi:hypothetical protein